MQDMVPFLDMQAPPEKVMSRQQLITKVSISILVMSLPVLYVSFLRVPPATLFRDTTFWFLMSNSIIVVIAADSGMLFFASSSSAYVDVDDRPFVVVSGDASMADELLPVVIANDDDPCSCQALVVARDHGDASVAVNGRAHPHALVVEGGEGGVVDGPAASGGMVMSISPPSFALANGAGDADGATVQARQLTVSKSVAREERARRRRSRSHSHHALVAVPPVQDKSVVVREEKLRRTATEGRHRPVAEEESEYSRLSDEELNRRVEDFITRFNREIRLQIEKEQA